MAERLSGPGIWAWIVYLLGRGRRHAWCELTGAHQDEIYWAWGGGLASHARVICARCSKTSRWYRVPDEPAIEAPKGE